MRFLPVFCLLLASVPMASGQGEKLMLRALALTPAEFPELWAAGSKGPVPLDFSPIQPSEPVEVNRTSPFPVFSGPLDEKGKPTDPKPSLLKLPNASSILLLGWLHQGNLQFLPIPDPFSTAKREDWLIINSTTTQVAMRIGDESTQPRLIKPGSHQTIRIEAPADQGVPVLMGAPRDDGWKTFYSTYWPVYPDQRCIVLMVDDGTRIRVKLIFDPVGQAAVKAAAD